jgi:hypothetical protein
VAFSLGISSLVLLLVVRQINKTKLKGKIPIPGDLIVVILMCCISEYGGGWETDANGTSERLTL